MSAPGPSRHFAAERRLGRFLTEADIKWQASSAGSVANDPKRTTPREKLADLPVRQFTKLSCTFHDRGGARSRSAANLLTRADRDGPLLGTYPAVCFAFDGGD